MIRYFLSWSQLKTILTQPVYLTLLSDLKLKQSFEETRRQDDCQTTDVCGHMNGHQDPSEQQHDPSLEETVETLLTRLREKRQSLGLPDNMKVRDHLRSAGRPFEIEPDTRSSVRRRWPKDRWLWRRSRCKNVCCILRAYTVDL